MGLVGASTATADASVKTMRLDLRAPTPGGPPASSINLRFRDDPPTRFVIQEIFQLRVYAPPPMVEVTGPILDVGANVGLAAAFFRASFPDAPIHCFEPDEATLPLLRENAARIGGCEVHDFGLFNADVERDFFVGRDSSVESSLHRAAHVESSPRRVRLRHAGDAIRDLNIPTPSIIKVDTEGAELEILLALRETLPAVPVLFVEFHSERDRRMVDQFLLATHVVWRGMIYEPHRGEYCFVRKDLVPATMRNNALT